MDYINCAKCGKVFMCTSLRICPECRATEEHLFQLVRDYIEEHPENKLKTIVADTGVSARRVLGYIKEGKLTVSKGLSGELTCEKCKKPVASGRFCESCVIDLKQQVDGLYQNKNAGAKMHTARSRS